MQFKYIAIIMILVVLLTVGAIVFIFIKNKNRYIVEEISEINESNIVDKKVKVKKKNKKIINSSTKENGTLINYDEYEMSTNEKILWSLVGVAVIFVIGLIFYNNVIWSLVVALIGIKYKDIKRKDIIYKRKQDLLIQFKEMLYSVSSSLSAGKSVEAAFKEAYEDMITIFGERKDIYILEELLSINRKLEMNYTLEEALQDLAQRSGLDDIKTFADVFIACNKTGGNLNKVIQNSSQVIGDKIEIKQEISVLISGKRLEAKILTFIPFILILLMGVMAPDLLKNLYTTMGRVLSTIALIIIGIATLWSNKITNIEV